MRRRHVTLMASVVGTALLPCVSSFADIPFEAYRTKYEEISENVLKDVRAILSLEVWGRRNRILRIYHNARSGFELADSIDLVTEAIWVSSYGYQPWDSETGDIVEVDTFSDRLYRYPVVAVEDSYVCVVSNPMRDVRVWVSIAEVEASFMATVARLDSFETPTPFLVDIFRFIDKPERKLYKEPKDGSEYEVIKGEGGFTGKYWPLKIIDQKNGFVRIALVGGWGDSGQGKETFEPLGWIKVRDERGRLTIWPADMDLWT